MMSMLSGGVRRLHAEDLSPARDKLTRFFMCWLSVGRGYILNAYGQSICPAFMRPPPTWGQKRLRGRGAMPG